jgi:hypothetical protein
MNDDSICFKPGILRIEGVEMMLPPVPTVEIIVDETKAQPDISMH